MRLFRILAVLFILVLTNHVFAETIGDPNAQVTGDIYANGGDAFLTGESGGSSSVWMNSGITKWQIQNKANEGNMFKFTNYDGATGSWFAPLRIEHKTPSNTLFLGANGRIGIGTNAPAAKLDVLGSGQFLEQATIANTEGNASLYVNGAGTSDSALWLNTGSNRWQFVAKGSGSNEFRFVNYDSASSSWFAPMKIEHKTPSNTLFLGQNGKVGVGTTTPETELDVNGEMTTNVLNIRGGSDLAEKFDIRPASADGKIMPGMVVSIDATRPGQLRISHEAYDTKVAGVISGAEGLATGMIMGQKDSIAYGNYPVALTGRVYVMADATHNQIVPGDMLTTSNIDGHVMAVKDYAKAQGAVVGKAMSGLSKGTGYVLVLVNLQ